jgi:hypothetical protein
MKQEISHLRVSVQAISEVKNMSIPSSGNVETPKFLCESIDDLNNLDELLKSDGKDRSSIKLVIFQYFLH